MNAISNVKREDLPSLLDRAADMLISAKTHADVLEARNQANFIYSAAKAASRIHKAKTAHDSLLVQVHRAQADALTIEAQAKMRLADEYDAAQKAGEVASHGNNVMEGNLAKPKVTTVSDLGLRHDQIHEARKLRDFERENPGRIIESLHEMVDRGEEPTKAALRREIAPKPKPKTMDDRALWIWGRLKDFDRQGVFETTADFLLQEMTEPMRDDMRVVVPRVRELLEDIEVKL